MRTSQLSDFEKVLGNINWTLSNKRSWKSGNWETSSRLERVLSGLGWRSLLGMQHINYFLPELLFVLSWVNSGQSRDPWVNTHFITRLLQVSARPQGARLVSQCSVAVSKASSFFCFNNETDLFINFVLESRPTDVYKSTKHCLTEMLLAINWRNWQAGKNHACVLRFKSPHASALHWNPPGFCKTKLSWDTFLIG